MPAQLSEKAKAQIMDGVASFLGAGGGAIKFNGISFSKSGDVFRVGFCHNGVEIAFEHVSGARLDLGDIIHVNGFDGSMGLEISN